MNENENKPGWDKLFIVLRHFTTFVAICGMAWIVAKPHAEAFIIRTVNDRVTKIEVQLTKQESLLWRIIRELDKRNNL